MKLNRSMAVAAALVWAVAANGVLAADNLPAAPAPSRATLAKLCPTCAVVRSVRTESRKGKSSGLGMVGGAVAGGALGSQVGSGSGSGKTVATFGGAIGGGLLGNEVEKHLKKQTVWVTTVTMKDGTLRRFEAVADPRLRSGDIVKVANGQIHRAS